MARAQRLGRLLDSRSVMRAITRLATPSYTAVPLAAAATGWLPSLPGLPTAPSHADSTVRHACRSRRPRPELGTNSPRAHDNHPARAAWPHSVCGAGGPGGSAPSLQRFICSPFGHHDVTHLLECVRGQSLAQSDQPINAWSSHRGLVSGAQPQRLPNPYVRELPACPPSGFRLCALQGRVQEEQRAHNPMDVLKRASVRAELSWSQENRPHLLLSRPPIPSRLTPHRPLAASDQGSLLKPRPPSTVHPTTVGRRALCRCAPARLDG